CSEVATRLAEPDRSPRDFVVLYRTNAQSRALEEALRRRDLPYQIVGGTRFYERREIMDVLAYLRVVSNPRDAGAFDRIVNYPRRGVGNVSQNRLLAWAAERGVAPLEAAAHAKDCPDLPAAATRALEKLAATLAHFRELAAHVGVGELLDKLLAQVGFMAALMDEGPEGEDRAENVQELVAGAYEFDEQMQGLDADEDEDVPDATALDLFLQKVSLITDVDRHDPDAEAVTLMTLHNAKGLEFPFVFISGLEDGLFPLARAFDEPDELEEERRLFYVGITRAQRKLYLTHARSRRRAGDFSISPPSSFLNAIPDDLLLRGKTPQLERRRQQSLEWRDRFGQRQSGRASSAGGLVVDYSDSQDAPRFIKGEVVVHPQFGRGTIRELSGFGRDLKAVIDFDDVGRKKVVVRYANLQKEL
ncbi:MAG: 3'-5' exonuclease, partial [Gemmatimonadota bacterium]